MQTVLELWNSRKATTATNGNSLSFGCPILDHAIGRIPAQGITEISGEAGAGKSQLCMSLALQAALPLTQGGLDGSTAYICCGEGEFPIRRLQQLAVAFEGRSTIDHNKLLSKVHIEKCYHSEALEDTVANMLPKMCNEQGIKLVVIDSIAGAFRTDFDATNAAEAKRRSTSFFRLSSKLKWIADVFKVVIVVVNQVTASGFDSRSSSSTTSNGSIPALGLSWTHCINTRIVLHRDTTLMRSLQWTSDHNINPPTGRGGTTSSALTLAGDTADRLDTIGVDASTSISASTSSIRTMVLVFSPYRTINCCKFKIVSEGVVGMN